MGALSGGQYPDSWDQYIGQDTAKHELRVAVKSAQLRKANLGHILISSPFAGIGKTALAQLVARYMGRPVIERVGSMNIDQVRMMFSECEDGDIVFLDEIHKAMDKGKANAEWMLHYLQDGVLMTPHGPETVPQVTIIGATTDAGILPEPILQRFKVIELEPYEDTEAALIVLGMAAKVIVSEGLPQLDDETAASIARASSNQPRLMRKLLISLRDLVLVEEVPTPAGGNYDLEMALKFSGLTWDGLPKEAQKYLTVMYVEMKGAPVGEALMRERLGLVGRGIQMVEALLRDKDLIMKTKQGRKLSAAGMRRARLLAETGA